MLYERSERSGAALVVALVTLAIAGAVSMSMIRTAVLRREHLQSTQRRVQVDWLLQSGIQRAAARLAADPQYEGETWQPLVEDLTSGAKAEVTIRIVQPATRSIVVSARYETAGKLAQRSRQVATPITRDGAQP